MQCSGLFPGDYSYADLDSIRTKKANDRAQRTAETTPRGVTFDPSVGMSSGGLMETRIGSVGTTNDTIHTDFSAHMY